MNTALVYVIDHEVRSITLNGPPIGFRGQSFLGLYFFKPKMTARNYVLSLTTG